MIGELIIAFSPKNNLILVILEGFRCIPVDSGSKLKQKSTDQRKTEEETVCGAIFCIIPHCKSTTKDQINSIKTF